VLTLAGVRQRRLADLHRRRDEVEARLAVDA
jgi:hypothetical protein